MIHYFIEVSIAWVLFYAIYIIFLKRETFFNVNRWYLVHTIWIGALIPLIRKIPLSIESVEPIILQPVQAIHYTTYAFSEAMSAPVEESFFNFQYVLFGLYFLGIMFFSFKFFHGLRNIWSLWKSGEKQVQEDFTLVLSDKYHLPFSFLKYVFLHRSFLGNDSIREIIDHEMIHVKSRHTFDVLFIEIVSILFWWNPIIYLYKKEIRQTHEYVADAYASQSTHIKNYGRILLGQSSSGIELALTNQFFNSHLKKRITMLYRKKSARYKLSKYLLVIPILFFLSVLYSFKNNPEGNKPIINLNTGIETAVSDFMRGWNDGCKDCDEKVEDNKYPEELLQDVQAVVSQFKPKDIDAVSTPAYGLVKKYDYNADYKNYIVDQLVANALLNQLELDIILNDDKGGSVCVSLIDDLRLVMYNPSNKLEVGETYKFKVFNAQEEDLSISIDPAKGSFMTSDYAKGKNGQYEFIFIPEYVTQGDDLMKIKVESGNEKAEMLFSVVNETSKITKESQKEKLENLLLHNGKRFDTNQYGESIALEKGGHIEVYDDAKEIKETFDIDLEGMKVINFIGKITNKRESKNFKLYQNVPNPFRDKTVIAFDLTTTENVSLTIYNIQNDVIKRYEEGFQIGENEITLSKSDLPKGKVFYYTLEVDGDHQTKKLVYIESATGVIENSQSIMSQTQNGSSMRLVTKWDQTKPLEVGKGYVFTLMNMDNNTNWRPKVILNEAELAKVEIIEQEKDQNSVDFLLRPISVTKDGKLLQIVFQNGKEKITKEFHIVYGKAEPKHEVHVSAASFLPSTITNPMIIIDGKISDSKDPHYFTESRIKSTKALTREESIKKYGDQSQDGALEVILHGITNYTYNPQADKYGGEVLKVVQVMPRFPGCVEKELTKDQKYECAEEKLLEWVYDNLSYPAEARDASVEGNVYMQFVIEEDGSVTHPNIVRDIGAGCGDAALDMLNKMSEFKWYPGMQNGKPVRVLFTLPVKFRLETQDDKVLVLENSDSNTSGKDCSDPIIILDGRRIKNVEDVSPDDIEEITVYKNEVPEKYAQYKNDCGIVEIISKNPKKYKDDVSVNNKIDSDSDDARAYAQMDFNDVPAPPPPPPPNPDKALSDFLAECDNPQFFLNGEEMPIQALELVNREDYKSLNISQDEDTKSKNVDENYCGVIKLRTINSKKVNNAIKEILGKNTLGQDLGYVLLKCIPNPFTDNVNVTFEIPQKETVEFSIYSMTGQRILKMEKETYEKGIHEITLESSDFPSTGAYLLRMAYGSKITFEKINFISNRE